MPARECRSRCAKQRISMRDSSHRPAQAENALPEPDTWFAKDMPPRAPVSASFLPTEHARAAARVATKSSHA
jgi:hypothetical protein